MSHRFLVVSSLLLATGIACSSEPATPPAPPPAPPAPPEPESPFAKELIKEWSDSHITWYVEAGVLGEKQVILLSEARFDTGPDGKPVPKPATMQVLTKTDAGWESSELNDPDGAVFHKAIIRDGKVLTISGAKPGAEGAQGILKSWTLAEDGSWSAETLWAQSWDGKIQRIRDLEIGDVDGDGTEEYVMATHDKGVIAVYELDGSVTELDPKPDTFTHEIEIGDIDGDGTPEFFATPSDRNQADASQHGEIVMYRWDGKAYVRSMVDAGESTHAKEILAADIDGDGTSEFFGVMEASLGPNKEIVTPVEIRQYILQDDGSFATATVATIPDRQTRFLVAADFDGDGRQELVAAAMKKGLFLYDTEDGSTWTTTHFEKRSGGFEHAANIGDMDGDGKPELYVVNDEGGSLARYSWK
jgi:hypothetical protein